MIGVDTGVDDIGDDSLSAGGVVPFVPVRAVRRELGAAGDASKTPRSVVLRLDGDMAVQLDRFNRIDLIGVNDASRGWRG